MAFGQQPGPPASAKQVQQLLALLQEAGHVDFRDARGPMGLTQRQAGGRFTRHEAEELIDRLHDAESEDAGDPVATRPAATTPAPARAAPQSAGSLSPADRAMGRLSSGDLAAELQRRGWIVIEP